jgi:hypothetical protein
MPPGERMTVQEIVRTPYFLRLPLLSMMMSRDGNEDMTSTGNNTEDVGATIAGRRRDMRP